MSDVHVFARVFPQVGSAVHTGGGGGGGTEQSGNVPIRPKLAHVTGSTEQSFVPAIWLVLQFAAVAVQVLVVHVFAAQLESGVHVCPGGAV